MDHIEWLRNKLTPEEISALAQRMEPPAKNSVDHSPGNEEQNKINIDPILGNKDLTKDKQYFQITNTGNATVEYGSVTPFNSINTAILILYNDKFGLHDSLGKFYSLLPDKIHALSEPRWDRKNPNLFYFIDKNKLCSFDIAKDWGTNAIKVIYTFAQYDKISGKGEGDISEDGNHLVLCGDDKEVLLYQFSTANALRIPWSQQIESLYVTPDNNILISSPTEVWLFNISKNKLFRVCSSDPHKDVIRSSFIGECLIWTNSNEAENGCPNGIIRTDLITLQNECLLSLGWSKRSGPDSMAVDISCADRDIALISTYGNDEDTLYANKLFTIDINNKNIKEVCAHGSKPLNNYNWQPRAAISRDGSKAIFNSNMGKSPDFNYSNVYFVNIS